MTVVGGFVTPSSQQELAEICATILRRQHWQLARNYGLAESPKGGLIRADILASDVGTGKRIAVFPRWQATSGTAEEKLPFQLIKFEMAKYASPDSADAAYFVIEGAGWTWRDFYLAGGLTEYLAPTVKSQIVSLTKFRELVLAREL